MKISWLYIMAFLLPLSTLSINIGTELSFYKLLPILMVILYIIKPFKISKNLFIILWILLLYMALNTGYHYFLNMADGRFQYAINNGWDANRTYMHMVIQLVFLSLGLIQIFLYRNFVKTDRNIHFFLNGFVDGNIFSAIVGMALIVLAKSGISISSLYYDSDIIRLSGLGNEPRHFSAFLLIAIFLLLIAKNKKLVIFKHYTIKRNFLLISLALSLSTSSIVAFIISYVVLLLFRFKTIKLRTVGSLIALVLVLGMIGGDSLIEVVNSRLFDRFENMDRLLYFIPKDGLAIYFLYDNINYLISGVGSGGITFYTIQRSFLDTIHNDLILNTIIINDVYSGKIGGSLTPSAFSIKFITEHGFIGYSVLIFFILRIIKRIRLTTYGPFIVDLSIVTFISSFIASAFLVYIYFIIIAVFYAYSYNQKRRVSTFDRQDFEIKIKTNKEKT